MSNVGACGFAMKSITRSISMPCSTHVTKAKFIAAEHGGDLYGYRDPQNNVVGKSETAFGASRTPRRAIVASRLSECKHANNCKHHLETQSQDEEALRGSPYRFARRVVGCQEETSDEAFHLSLVQEPSPKQPGVARDKVEINSYRIGPNMIWRRPLNDEITKAECSADYK
eukprot:CAMPEP_0169302638 /NCGR_PEP_ID=MMETSP1016-20121227/68906_1 /TAXON_ID=342587 /ORGANISM="Karlodinium micrum, Strain CCMP2283" /LENGTH=170 /DNA_ID=CAMNT_0009395361 /DNA_START=665 /DNA_END=1176 /DNA_ORIENTATION=+